MGHHPMSRKGVTRRDPCGAIGSGTLSLMTYRRFRPLRSQIRPAE